jgi:hypothetical protein
MFQLLRESALEILILTFIIALGAILLGSSYGLQKTIDTTAPNIQVSNESINFAVNNTWYPVGNTPLVSLDNVTNTTVNEYTAIKAGNWTSNATHVRLQQSPSTGGINVGTYLVTYTFQNYYTYEANISGAGVVALNTYSNYFGILVIAIIFVAIIGLIMLVAGSGKTKV